MHPLVLFPVFLVHLVPVLGHLSVLPLPHSNHHLHHFLHQAHLGFKLLFQLLQEARANTLHLLRDLLALVEITAVYIKDMVLCQHYL